MTAMRSHMLSSSSRSVEISRIARPRAAVSRMRWRVGKRVGKIEAVGRLVEDHHLGAVGQFARQQHLLDVATRQPADRRVQARRSYVVFAHQFAGTALDLAALFEAAAPEWRFADLLEEEVDRDGEGADGALAQPVIGQVAQTRPRGAGRR